MNDTEKLAIAVQALEDIVDPISKMRRELPYGYILDGYNCVKMSEDHNFLKQEAAAALKKIG